MNEKLPDLAFTSKEHGEQAYEEAVEFYDAYLYLVYCLTTDPDEYKEYTFDGVEPLSQEVAVYELANNYKENMCKILLYVIDRNARALNMSEVPSIDDEDFEDFFQSLQNIPNQSRYISTYQNLNPDKFDSNDPPNPIRSPRQIQRILHPRRWANIPTLELTDRRSIHPKIEDLII